MNRFATILFVIAAVLALSLQPFISFAATPQNGVATGASVVISEVYPNSALDPEKPAIGETPTSQHEFIELYNRGSTPVSLHALQLVRDDDATDEETDGAMLFSEGSKPCRELDSANCLAPGEYRAFSPPFSLLNGGTTLQLFYIGSENSQPLLIQQLNYTSVEVPEESSLQLYEKQWYILSPTTPGFAPLWPEEDTSEPTGDKEPNTQPCEAENVHLSEILPNPNGNDDEGGEFVELFNSSQKPILLLGCNLSTDKLDSYEFTADDKIAPQSYLQLPLSDNLLNSGGRVTFSAKTYDETVQYPDLDENEAYAKIKGSWQSTKKPTPGEENRQPTQLEIAGVLNARLGPCPAGQVRNVQTHRCNSEKAASALEACDANQFRNPATNRCKLIGSSGGLEPCEPNQFRNPATNRCKLKDSNDGLKPCDEGEYRSSETNRCRNKEQLESGVLGSADSNNDENNQNTGQNLALVLIAGTFLVFFLAYEYRHSVAGWLAKFRPQPDVNK